MTSWTVFIPGMPPYTAIAPDEAAALIEALDNHGLHFAPDGTTVKPSEETTA